MTATTNQSPSMRRDIGAVVLAWTLLLASAAPSAASASANTSSELAPHAHLSRQLQQLGTAANIAGIISAAVGVTSVFDAEKETRKRGGTQVRSVFAASPNYGFYTFTGFGEKRRATGQSQCLDGKFDFPKHPCNQPPMNYECCVYKYILNFAIGTWECGRKDHQLITAEGQFQGLDYNENGSPYCFAALLQARARDVNAENFGTVCGIKNCEGYGEKSRKSVYTKWDIDPVGCDGKQCLLCDDYDDERAYPQGPAGENQRQRCERLGKDCPPFPCRKSSGDRAPLVFQIKAMDGKDSTGFCLTYQDENSEVKMEQCEQCDDEKCDDEQLARQLWYEPGFTEKIG